MSEIDTQRLRALAEAATPGLWEAAQGASGGWWIESPYTATVADIDIDSLCPEADAQHIAAANPATILALLDRLEAAEAAVAAHDAEVRRAAGERIALPTNYALRCASCGDKATTTVVLEGFRTPVCLRHYNVWHTPEFDAHMCGIACEKCRDHDPRDRREHGHLSPALCPACIAREEQR